MDAAEQEKRRLIALDTMRKCRKKMFEEVGEIPDTDDEWDCIHEWMSLLDHASTALKGGPC